MVFQFTPKFGGKLIIIYIITYLMTSYKNHHAATALTFLDFIRQQQTYREAENVAAKDCKKLQNSAVNGGGTGNF